MSSSNRFAFLLIIGALIASLVIPAAAFAAPPADPASESSSGPRDSIARESIAKAALQYVGAPYKLGAEGPVLFDCSGLVYRAFADAGRLDLVGGRRMLARGYYRWFVEQGRLSKTDGRVGDLVVYTNGQWLSHIGIYIGGGKAVSALVNPAGITVHGVNSLTIEFVGFLHLDDNGSPNAIRPENAPPAGSPNGQPAQEPIGPSDPFADIEWGEPEISGDLRAGQVATVSLPASGELDELPGLRLNARWALIEDEPLAEMSDAALAFDLPADTLITTPTGLDEEPESATDWAQIWASAPEELLTVSVPTRLNHDAESSSLQREIIMPEQPGNYELKLRLRDSSGRQLLSDYRPAFAPLTVEVATPFSARYEVASEMVVGRRNKLTVPLRLVNDGLLDWQGHTTETPTWLVASWLSQDGEQRSIPAGWLLIDPDAEFDIPLAPEAELDAEIDPDAELEEEPVLAPGLNVELTVATPRRAGEYVLQLDIIDADYGSLSGQGVEPGSTTVLVVKLPDLTVADEEFGDN